jgi:hypothetical protein
MATTANAQAIAFVNNMARRYADAEAQAYNTAKALNAFWNANSVSGVVPNDATIILDGAATDGRQIVTGAQTTNVVTRCQEKIADYEANSSAKLNTILALAVNTTSHI